MVAKRGVFCADLVFKLSVESKLVLGLPIRHFVPPEPVNGGLQIARLQALDVANVLRTDKKERIS